MQHSNTAGCILLKFYIKPQHTANVYNLLYVVSYRNSTSNHNMSHWRATSQGVVSYRNSTSNHNAGTTTPNSALLYLIEILHQTTTQLSALIVEVPLYLIEILHQTTTRGQISLRRCGLYLIEILHQTTTLVAIPLAHIELYLIEILHQTTTLRASRWRVEKLYLIEILHQTTTMWLSLLWLFGCILSKFYIKPQQ